MKTGIVFAIIIALSIYAMGLAAREQPGWRPLEIVPPQPRYDFSTRDFIPPASDWSDVSLRKLAEARGVLIGAAVEPEDMSLEASYNATLAREFNMLAPENVLKFGLVRGGPHRYDFGSADMIVDFAARHDMKVRGHTLVWHVEIPDWLKVRDMDRGEAMALLQQHIKTVVGRYKGHIHYWDVLNEAVERDGSLRDTIWLRAIGPDYIDMVFHWAHEADPQARLFYNDYGAEGLGDKSDAVYELVSGLLERGVPVHGVGLQGHFSTEEQPSYGDMSENLARLGELGLEVQFTEVDVRIPEPVTRAKLEEQAGVYWITLDVCLRQPACTGFITWGLTDKFSWIPRFLEGYTAGLMFDEHYQPKPAYWALRDVLQRSLAPAD